MDIEEVDTLLDVITQYDFLQQDNYMAHKDDKHDEDDEDESLFSYDYDAPYGSDDETVSSDLHDLRSTINNTD
eukprot:9039528-Ditylum_brightwellii.AAC.1